MADYTKPASGVVVKELSEEHNLDFLKAANPCNSHILHLRELEGTMIHMNFVTSSLQMYR